MRTGPGRDLLADRSAGSQHLARRLEVVGLEHVATPLGSDGFRARLDHVELPVDAVLGPFHVHRARLAGLRAVVLLDLDGVVGQREHLLVADAEARRSAVGRRYIAGGRRAAAVRRRSS